MRISIGNVSRKVAVAIAAIFSSLYLLIFFEQTSSTSPALPQKIVIFLPLLVFFASLFLFLEFKKLGFFQRLLKYRYLVGGILFALVVAFGISGSSIGIWENFLPDSQGSGVLWGTYRSIRSDEWGILTPFIFSQEQIGFLALNDLLRGTETCVTLSPNLPAFAVVSLFKPSYWGFLLFGVERGLAWYWAFHVVLMFLFTFDIARILTKNNILSIVTAVLVTFSPCVQWWGSLEAVQFGELIVVLLHVFLYRKSLVAKMLAAIGIPWVCGCFLFLAYPPWQIPFFYIFLAFGIWIIFTYMKSRWTRAVEQLNTPFDPKLLIPLACSLIVIALLSVYSFQEGALCIEGTAKSIYPGQRSSTGGGQSTLFFDWCVSVFFAIAPSGSMLPNECEASVFFSVFPISLIICIYALVKTRSRFLLCLLLLDAVFILFAVVGFPEFLARVTLFNLTTPSRIVIPESYLEILMLVISISFLMRVDTRREKVGSTSTRVLRPLCVVVASVFVFFLFVPLLSITSTSGDFWSKRIILLYCLMILLLILVAITAIVGKQAFLRTLLVASFAIVGVSGICVNPVQNGTEVITENPLYKEIEGIADGDPDSLWIAEGGPYESNMCVAAGARTLSSTNMYPNDEAWAQLDSNGEYQEVYMRYTNITVDVEEQFENAEVFELLYADAMKVNLTPEQLKILGVKYLLADEVHDDTDGLEFREVYKATSSSREFIIYELYYE